MEEQERLGRLERVAKASDNVTKHIIKRRESSMILLERSVHYRYSNLARNTVERGNIDHSKSWIRCLEPIQRQSTTHHKTQTKSLHDLFVGTLLMDDQVDHGAQGVSCRAFCLLIG